MFQLKYLVSSSNLSKNQYLIYISVGLLNKNVIILFLYITFIINVYINNCFHYLTGKPFEGNLNIHIRNDCESREKANKCNSFNL
ncbi:hypothetical protein MAR_016855 [Mya arenaria]|uniref:Uncharacterized protein n=1 Tax=Mya arenaria TaxID=6604 RepID=A0ABY7EDL4_MYAAR|nr:hypothetical protein MAR_016855 [Mya arenaria]